MPGLLAKLDDVKAQAGFSGAAFDVELTRLLKRASATVAALVGVDLVRVVDRVTYPVPLKRTLMLWLDRHPVESITSVKIAGVPTADFSAITALIENEDYFVAAPFGRITLATDIFAPFERSQEIIYTAGYADPNEALPGGAAFAPDDLQGAIVDQVIAWRKGGKDVGATKISAGTGGSYETAPREALPALVEACRRYRRVLL